MDQEHEPDGRPAADEGVTADAAGLNTDGAVTPVPPPRRRVPAPVILLALVLALVGAVGGAIWTGYRLYDEPFVRFNMNRLDAAADRVWRDPKAVAVVALGSTPLRAATLDETAMGKLAARRGIPALHIVRIVDEAATFAEFEPLLARIVRLRPALVLLDLDLLFAERNLGYFFPAYLGRLGDVVQRGQPYLRDQIALQYAKPCPRRDSPDWEATADLGAYVAQQRAMVERRADSPAFDRVSAFAVAAQAAGIRVALLSLPKPAAVEERLNADRTAPLEDMADLPRVPVWHYPRDLDDRRDFCDFAHVTPETREAYSAWLTSQIAEALRKPAVEEVSLVK